MSKFKSVLSLLLVVVVTASLAVSGTMAYLTQDAGNEKNVFSVGNIDVSLSEEVGVYGEGGQVEKSDDGAEYTEIMPGDYLKKEVTVTNNGKTDAYVAVTVTMNNGQKISKAIDTYYETKLGDSDTTDTYIYEMYNYIFDGWGMNYYHNNEYGYDARNTITQGDTYNTDWPEHVLKVDYTETMDIYWLYSKGNWFKSDAEMKHDYWTDGAQVNGDFSLGYYTKNLESGSEPYTWIYTYYIDLPAGESTTLFKGLNVPAEFTNEQMAMFDGLEINVEAKAIQADNMGIAEIYKNDVNGEAKTAFAVLAGAIDADSLGVNNNPSAPVGYQVNNDAELAEAISAGETVIWLNPNSYSMPDAAQGKTLTINGTKDAIVNMRTENDGYDASDYSLDGSTVTFNGITHQAATSGSAQGYARASLTFNNCDLKGYMDLPETAKTSFSYCTFDVSGDLYCIWTWGSDEVYFDHCTFNTDGKALLVYNADTNVYIDYCTFNDRTNGTGFTKSAIETGADYGPKTYNIYITETKVNGFAENNVCVGYMNIVGNKNQLSKDYLNIVVNGTDVY